MRNGARLKRVFARIQARSSLRSDGILSLYQVEGSRRPPSVGRRLAALRIRAAESAPPPRFSGSPSAGGLRPPRRMALRILAGGAVALHAIGAAMPPTRARNVARRQPMCCGPLRRPLLCAPARRALAASAATRKPPRFYPRFCSHSEQKPRGAPVAAGRRPPLGRALPMRLALGPRSPRVCVAAGAAASCASARAACSGSQRSSWAAAAARERPRNSTRRLCSAAPPLWGGLGRRAGRAALWWPPPQSQQGLRGGFALSPRPFPPGKGARGCARCGGVRRRCKSAPTGIQAARSKNRLTYRRGYGILVTRGCGGSASQALPFPCCDKPPDDTVRGFCFAHLRTGSPPVAASYAPNATKPLLFCCVHQTQSKPHTAGT